MIRFFRSLRQRLLSENRFRNYLLYAIGEIILVVIGILIALQVNNWNSERQERRVSENYLIKLSGELEMMLNEYKAQRPWIDYGRIEAMQALEYLENCGSPDSLRPAFIETLLTHQVMMKYPEFRNTYDEMISVGAFAGVEDPDVKSRLFQTYNALTRAQTQIDYFRDEVGRASSVINRYVQFSYAGDGNLTVSGEPALLCENLEFRNALVEIVDARSDWLSGLDDITATMEHAHDGLNSAMENPKTN